MEQLRLQVHFAATLSATGGTTYAWSGPNTFTSTAATSTITNVTAANAGTYTVTISDANTCSVIKTTNLVVNPKPSVLIIAGNATPCASSTSVYSITPNAGENYTWSVASGGTLQSSPVANNQCEWLYARKYKKHYNRSESNSRSKCKRTL
jgi:hypothetical protein